MIKNNLDIRLIIPSDNESIAQVIRTVLIEMGVPKIGSTYEDKTLDMMYETYQDDRAVFYVIEGDSGVVGGGGIAPLIGEEQSICELQKMYFLPEARGKGMGMKMIKKCLDFALKNGYTSCYLETMPYMKAARSLYAKVGFEDLDGPLGNTGHYSCQSWMMKKL